MTTLSGGMTGGGVITMGKVTPSGPVMVGVGGGGGGGEGWGAVGASGDRAAAYRERIGRNLIKTMISRGGNGRLDNGAHGAFGTRQGPGGSIGVDLVAGEFGLAKLAGDERGASGAVLLLGVAVGLVEGEDEDFLQHFDDVIIGVIVVIEEDDAVQRDQAIALEDFSFRGQRRVRHDT